MAALPFTVRAVYEYKSDHDDDLKFPIGQIISVTEEEDADWYVGNYLDSSGSKQEGLFPKNFVEKYEPPAPPRPSRPRPKKETTDNNDNNTITPPKPDTSLPVVAPPLHQTPPTAPSAYESPPAAVITTKSTEAKQEPSKVTSGPKGPPPVISQKPSSFKDRIAAFNRGSDAPLAPIKPGAPFGSNSYTIKKSFVAPPPARDAYVPPPQQHTAPQKSYRWEEDPEAAERRAQDLEDATKAGLVVSSEKSKAEDAEEGQEEETPKPTSLKDRIALLQKQQQEQAARRADVSQKEKPKKPVKKRTESDEIIPPVPSSGDTDPQDTGVGNNDKSRLDQQMSRDSRRPEPPPRELQSDENDADQSEDGDTTEDNDGESTEVEDQEDKAQKKPKRSTQPEETAPAGERASFRYGDDTVQRVEVDDRTTEGTIEEAETIEKDEEEIEMDAETRRKIELRERMAKMSGGMGMPGMFGPAGGMPMPGPVPRKKKAVSSDEQTPNEPRDANAAASPGPRMSMVPIPGLQRVQSPDIQEAHGTTERVSGKSSVSSKRDPQELPEVEDTEAGSQVSNGRAPPPIPQDRPLPDPPAAPPRGAAPPVPQDRPRQSSTEMRAPPPPPPAHAAESVAMGEEEEEEEVVVEEEEEEARNEEPPQAVPLSSNKRYSQIRGPPPPVPAALPPRPEVPRSPPLSSSQRISQVLSDPPAPSTTDKRASKIPPIPSGAGAPSGESRPLPPPPPTAPPARRSLDHENSGQMGREDDEEDEQEEEEEEAREEDDEEGEGGESVYEGDYDTDIASGASHRDALKAHQRTRSIDDSIYSDGSSFRSPQQSRAPPPPPPHQVPPRQSSEDPPRVAPPPPSRPPVAVADADDDYDPYRYSDLTPGADLPRKKPLNEPVQASDIALYGTKAESGTGSAQPPIMPQSPPRERAPPPLPPNTAEIAVQQSPRLRQSTENPRPSADLARPSMSTIRRSVEQSRPSGEHGQIAQDIDLGLASLWWTQSNTAPPILQGRTDVLCEFEESSASKRGGRTTTSRDVYALFADYSQTIISARFDPKAPQEASVEQRHEPPPLRPRQEELEAAHGRFGQQIAATVASKQNQVVGDGTAISLVKNLLQTQPNVLLPVGTRSFGALIYANMANASVLQYDEIRAGDVITFRNSKFQGKHGPMHAKYSEDVGKPDHVGIVAEWDGSKRKVRVFEQGREKGKVRLEGFRVGDLRSGEVKVWRVMGREWVGWES